MGVTRRQVNLNVLQELVRCDWRPVCAEFAEDDYGNPLPAVQVDLICEWRMHDGKVQFVQVAYRTAEELAAIRECLASSIPPFVQALNRKFALEPEPAA